MWQIVSVIHYAQKSECCNEHLFDERFPNFNWIDERWYQMPVCLLYIKIAELNRIEKLLWLWIT